MVLDYGFVMHSVAAFFEQRRLLAKTKRISRARHEAGRLGGIISGSQRRKARQCVGTSSSIKTKVCSDKVKRSKNEAKKFASRKAAAETTKAYKNAVLDAEVRVVLREAKRSKNEAKIERLKLRIKKLEAKILETRKLDEAKKFASGKKENGELDFTKRKIERKQGKESSKEKEIKLDRKKERQKRAHSRARAYRKFLKAKAIEALKFYANYYENGYEEDAEESDFGFEYGPRPHKRSRTPYLCGDGLDLNGDKDKGAAADATTAATAITATTAAAISVSSAQSLVRPGCPGRKDRPDRRQMTTHTQTHIKDDGNARIRAWAKAFPPSAFRTYAGKLPGADSNPRSYLDYLPESCRNYHFKGAGEV